METVIHKDERGSHSKFFTRHAADEVDFKGVHEVFMTTNNKGTLRGLHRQFGEGVTQQKIVIPTNGSFNVRMVLPLADVGEKVFVFFIENYNRQIEQITISPDYLSVYYDNVTPGNDPIFVPAGAYLGYVALEDNSKMLYVGDNDFNNEADDGRNPFSLDIDWGYDGPMTISNRDKGAPYLVSSSDDDFPQTLEQSKY